MAWYPDRKDLETVLSRYVRNTWEKNHGERSGSHLRLWLMNSNIPSNEKATFGRVFDSHSDSLYQINLVRKQISSQYLTRPNLQTLRPPILPGRGTPARNEWKLERENVVKRNQAASTCSILRLAICNVWWREQKRKRLRKNSRNRAWKMYSITNLNEKHAQPHRLQNVYELKTRSKTTRTSLFHDFRRDKF